MSLAGGIWFSQFFPKKLLFATTPAFAQQAASAPADPVAAFRAQMGSIPIQAQKLADNLTLLSGPGGNVAVLDGRDGKLLVDTFVSPAWLKLKNALDSKKLR